MITIIAHQGLWKEENERNGLVAFRGAFESKFGVQLDVRDFSGQLIVSHNPPNGTQPPTSFDDFIAVYRSWGRPSIPIALNIRSCGLENMLSVHRNKPFFENCFLFGLTVSEAVTYAKSGYHVFTRQNEYEKIPAFYEEACGVCLDELNSTWVTQQVIMDHVRKGKHVCIASPELHQREYLERWKQYKAFFQEMDQGKQKIILCTGHPEEANYFFNGKK